MRFPRHCSNQAESGATCSSIRQAGHRGSIWLRILTDGTAALPESGFAPRELSFRDPSRTCSPKPGEHGTLRRSL
jgi:hypothetical protein